uniref:Uncharacterized protein n=1 Tax=Rhizophora mucronata TaxID=61149 RepID=A0A2P2P491_RHIMU
MSAILVLASMFHIVRWLFWQINFIYFNPIVDTNCSFIHLTQLKYIPLFDQHNILYCISF